MTTPPTSDVACGPSTADLSARNVHNSLDRLFRDLLTREAIVLVSSVGKGGSLKSDV